MRGLVASPWTGWGVAAVIAVLHFASAREPSAPPAPAPAQPSVVSALDGELGLLRACRNELSRATQRSAPADATGSSRNVAPIGAAAGAGGATAELRDGKAPTSAPLAAHGEAGATAPSIAKDAREAGSRLLQSLVSASPEETVVLTEYVCAAQDIKRAGLADLKRALDAPEPGRNARIAEASDQLEAQRELVLSDFEKKLGKDRYAKFRAVGGLGLMSDVMTCER